MREERGMELNESLEYVVGEEKRLRDVLGADEVLPLLDGAVSAGLEHAVVVGEKGVPLWSSRQNSCDAAPPCCADGPGTERLPILLEGEAVAWLCLAGGDVAAEVLAVVGRILAESLNRLATANLKRMLTTELHTRVVNQSYEELVASNRELSRSEQRYRELASSLEERVKKRTAELKRAYARLAQQEKLASVGQLAAGMAHEINNPLGFVLSNLRTLEKYLGQMGAMLQGYRTALVGTEGVKALRKATEEQWRQRNLDFILEDLEALFTESFDGCRRIQRLVAELRRFSHVDDRGEGLVDINAELERTLIVMAPQAPQGVEIQRDFADLPCVLGNAGALCQVFFNIVRNAFQARSEGLRLRIRTRPAESGVRIDFIDNGPGIPREIRARVLDPFFTTREVGEGTGLGLTVAHDVIRGHEGHLNVASPAVGGTVVSIELPAQGA